MISKTKNTCNSFYIFLHLLFYNNTVMRKWKMGGEIGFVFGIEANFEN